MRGLDSILLTALWTACGLPVWSPATAAGDGPAETAACKPGTFCRPTVLRFGTTVAAMEEALAERCRTVDSYEIDPPFLPEVEERQMQIDCDGFEFRGAERWVELVFRDDSLVMVWILTAAEEEPALLAAMTAAYGDPTHRGDDYFAWVDHLAALRRDKPEVLFYSGALAEVYGPWFDDNVGRAPPP